MPVRHNQPRPNNSKAAAVFRPHPSGWRRNQSRARLTGPQGVIRDQVAGGQGWLCLLAQPQILLEHLVGEMCRLQLVQLPAAGQHRTGEGCHQLDTEPLGVMGSER